MCRRENLKPRGLVVRSWQEWEAGARPSWDYQDLLSRLFHANPVELGWAPDYAPAADSIPALRARPDHRAPQPLMQLPPDTDDFTGRRHDVERLIRALTTPSVTAVAIAAISGKAGVGKTALAVHVAHQIQSAFPGGQLYVNLDGTRTHPVSPGEVLAGFLREFGVPGSEIPEDLDERARRYRAQLADRRMLVVLDNAADETQLRPLLPGSAGCAVLVTSRTPMTTLAGIHVDVDVLTEDEAVTLLTVLIGSDRADAEPDAVRQLARLCGALPLALRIAAARLTSRSSWTLAWFAARLSDETRRLDLLTAGDLQVRASFELSYRGRSDIEQSGFRLLSLTAATFPAWNLAALLDTDVHQAEQVLESLADAQLVEIAGIDATGLPRYRLHDLIRDFARERCLAHETEQHRQAAARRLIGRYTATVLIAAQTLHPGTEHDIESDVELDRPDAVAAQAARSDPRRWFIIEQANLIAAVDLAHRLGLPDQTWRLAAALPALFDWRADWQAWSHTHELALQATIAITDTDHPRAVILRNLGALDRELGRYDAATAVLDEAAHIFLRLDDQRRWATTMKLLGDTHRYRGHLDDALTAFSASLLTAECEQDSRSVAGVLNGLGDASRGLSQWSEATRYFEESLAIYRNDLHDDLDAARTRVRYALVYRDQWKNEQALQLLTPALAVFTDFDDLRWQARTLRHIAVVHRNAGDLHQAWEPFERSLALFERLADRRGVAVTLRNRGDAHRLADNPDLAERDLTRACEIFTSINDHRWIARCHLGLTDLHRTTARYELAHHYLDTAFDIIFRTSGDRPAQARARRQLGILARDTADYDTAATALLDAHARFTTLGDQLWIARVDAGLARLAQRLGQDPTPHMKEALAICHRNAITIDHDIETVLKEW